MVSISAFQTLQVSCGHRIVNLIAVTEGEPVEFIGINEGRPTHYCAEPIQHGCVGRNLRLDPIAGQREQQAEVAQVLKRLEEAQVVVVGRDEKSPAP